MLAKIAGADPAELAAAIFSVGSPLLTMTPEQAIAADSKLYEEDGNRFTVAQIEELSFSHFEEKREALLEALDAHWQREGLLFAALLVTDINTQSSLLLIRGAEHFWPHRLPASRAFGVGSARCRFPKETGPPVFAQLPCADVELTRSRPAADQAEGAYTNDFGASKKRPS